MSRRTRHRLQILRNGYEPLPANGKIVSLPKWNSREIDRDEIQSWTGRSEWQNTSIRCHNLVAIDIDVDDQLLVNSIIAQTRIELGNSPFERIGRKPRCMLIYRAKGARIGKRKISFRHRGSSFEIEILGHGQQFVAYGIHPDTKAKYRWVGRYNPANTPVRELPGLSPQDVDDFETAIKRFLIEQGCEVISSKRRHAKERSQGHGRIHLDYLKAAMEYIPAEDYDEWISVGMAIHYETGGSSDGLNLWEKWSQDSGKYNESRSNECHYKWQSFREKPNRITGATVLNIAKTHGFDLSSYIGPRENLTREILQLPADGPYTSPREEQRDTKRLRGRFPSRLLGPPGLVGLAADYCNRSAFRHQPILAICGGLITVAALSRNWFVVGPWRTTLNVYIIGVAETGEGKEATRKSIKEMLTKANALDSLKESVASSPALLRALSSSPRHDISLLLDEFGRLLSVAGNPSNGHLFELISELMRLFGQGDSTHAGKIYANASDNIPKIKRPFVNLYGTTTRRSLTESLSSKDVVDGTLNRFLVVPTENRQPRYTNPNFHLGERLENALKNLSNLDVLEFDNDDHGSITDPMVIEVTDEAEKILLDYRQEADDLRVASEAQGPLYARAFENAVKISGIVALGCAADRGPIHQAPPVVDQGCAEWAIGFVRWSVGNLVSLGKEEIADSYIERITTKIRSYIESMATDWEQTCAPRDAEMQEMNRKGFIAKSQITKRFQKERAQIRDEAIKTLVESGDIAAVSFDEDNTQWFSPRRD